MTDRWCSRLDQEFRKVHLRTHLAQAWPGVVLIVVVKPEHS